ncbi:hypothetical protein [Amycolatopsis sp. lyj-23]|uniref:hypothetical protein n=1 Tax=Amycolatopsis sp. lyj-23 TaxID=2789283 RepID=UPI00397D6D0D
MTDLDELRRALRAQEVLAPDPEAVLAVATRRIRRRRAAGVAAVVLTVAALGTGAIALVNRTTPPATLASPASAVDAVAPAAEKVPPAPPAISLDDGSWTLAMWSIQPHVAALHYGQAQRYAFEIDVRDGAAPHGTLLAKPSAAGQLANPRDVRWQDGPDRWIWVRTTKPVTAADMLALLGKIRTTPPVLASPLKSVSIPDGQKVDTFTSEPETNTLMLCPDPEVAKLPVDSRCLSLTVSLTSRFAESSVPDDPLPLHRHRTVGAYTVEVDSSHANEQAALKLLDSVRLDR